MYRITAVNRNFTLKTSLNSIWRGTLQDNIQASIRYPTKPVIMSLNGLIATLPTLFPPNDSSSTGVGIKILLIFCYVSATKILKTRTS